MRSILPMRQTRILTPIWESSDASGTLEHRDATGGRGRQRVDCTAPGRMIWRAMPAAMARDPAIVR
jgi:hypothetical protein